MHGRAKWLVAMLSVVQAGTGSAAVSSSHCQPGEGVALNCVVSNPPTLVSICVNTSRVTYRSGPPGHPDYTYPAAPMPFSKAFEYAHQQFPGGVNNALSFKDGGVEYSVQTSASEGGSSGSVTVTREPTKPKSKRNESWDCAEVDNVMDVLQDVGDDQPPAASAAAPPRPAPRPASAPPPPPPNHEKSCAMEGKVRSSQATTRARLRLINGTPERVTVFWLDQEGKRVEHDALGMGGSVWVTTSPGHLWLVRGASGACYGIYEVKRPTAQIVIR